MENNSIVAVANTADSSISIINPSTLKEVRRIKLSQNTGPYDLIKWDSRRSIIISQCFDDSLAYIDLTNGQVLDTVVLGRRPSHITYDKVKNLIYITNGDSDTISIIDGDKMMLEGQISVGLMPQGIDCSVGLRSIAIANINSNDVWIIDADTLEIKTKIKLGRCPLQVKFSIDGRYLYIGCSCPKNDMAGSVMVLDTLKYNIQWEIDLGGIPGQLYGTKDDGFLFATSIGRGGLDIIDINKEKLIKRIATNGMTQGIAVDNEERYIYVTNTYEDFVSVIDWRAGEVVIDIKVGKEPNGIIFI